MHEMQTVWCPSVCLLCDSSQLHCVMVQIKILFIMNTVSGPRIIVLDGSADPPTVTVRGMESCPGQGHVIYFWCLTLHRISGMAAAGLYAVWRVCSAFDAAFAKLLWLLVLPSPPRGIMLSDGCGVASVIDSVSVSHVVWNTFVEHLQNPLYLWRKVCALRCTLFCERTLHFYRVNFV